MAYKINDIYTTFTSSTERVPLTPLDRALINIELLEKSEIDWINSYHAKVLDKISPLVDKKTQTWLLKATVNL